MFNHYLDFNLFVYGLDKNILYPLVQPVEVIPNIEMTSVKSIRPLLLSRLMKGREDNIFPTCTSK